MDLLWNWIWINYGIPTIYPSINRQSLMAIHQNIDKIHEDVAL